MKSLSMISESQNCGEKDACVGNEERIRGTASPSRTLAASDERDLCLCPRRRRGIAEGRGLTFSQKKRWWLRPRREKRQGQRNALSSQTGNLSRRLHPGCRHRGRSQGAAVPLGNRLDQDALRTADAARRCLAHGRRRAADAEIETAIGCHSFRVSGITDYLTNGGRIEVAQRMAGHSNAKTTGLYDRRNDDIGLGEVEWIGI